MFGYIKPCKPELKIRDFDMYQAAYCGLCRQLGRSFGPFARLSLSYDFTFLCMLGEALCTEPGEISLQRCCFNPLRKVHMCAQSTPLVFSADTAAIMVYYKLRDNMQDSSLAGRVGWSLLYPWAAHVHRKAAKAQPVCDEIMSRWMERQAILEAANTPNVDEACEPTAAAMGAVFRLLSKQEDAQRVLERMGYCMGRYIYLCDALDDLESDLKSGGYNPFLLRYKQQNSGSEAAADEALAKIREDARESLYLSAAEAAKAYALLDIHRFKPVLDNIFECGLRAGVEAILCKVGGKKQ